MYTLITMLTMPSYTQRSTLMTPSELSITAFSPYTIGWTQMDFVSRQDWSNRDRHRHKTQVGRNKSALLRPVYSDTTQLNSTSSWVELRRYKHPLKVADATIPVKTTVKSLGVDSRQHAVLRSTCQQRLQGSPLPRPCLTSHPSLRDAKVMATTLMSSRLDYCNSVLSGTSQSNLNKLQRVQNAVARTVMTTSKREHITPVLAELYWLHA